MSHARFVLEMICDIAHATKYPKAMNFKIVKHNAIRP